MTDPTTIGAFDTNTTARWAELLLEPGACAPPGLRSWNGSDPARRFAVHRNNVLASLGDALAETFPVLREVVGADCFGALALAFVRQHPPRHPVLADWGEDFGPWLDHIVTRSSDLAALPWLGDLARLEQLRQRCCHAADASALSPQALAGRLAEPARLPHWRPGWHPAAAVWRSRWAVLSLWTAHQRQDPSQPVSLAGLDIHRPEAALLLRSAADEVLLWPLSASAAAFCAALASGAPFGEAQRLSLAEPGADSFDLVELLTLLLRHGVLVEAPPTRPSVPTPAHGGSLPC